MKITHSPVGPEAHLEPTGDELSEAAARGFRGAAATVQYLSHDRADLGLAAAILATRMARPRVSDVDLLHRTVAYLRTHPEMSLLFEWGSATDRPRSLQLYTDSDWASCHATRKSRSGGAVQYSGRTVAHWCRHQDTVSLSSGEAELKSSCKGFAECIGLRAVIEFLTGASCGISHATDASACLGVLKRRGAGTIKHLTVKQLWVQEVSQQPGVECRKIPRKENPADMMCSVQTGDGLRNHLGRLHYTDTRNIVRGGDKGT